MAQLSIVAGSEVATPSSGTQMNPASFREAALAPGRVGAAIGDNVGGFFQDVSQKIQQNRNARMVFDADLAMRKTKEDFTANLVNMPDEGTWVPAWREQVDSLRSKVMDNPRAGPDTQRMLSKMFDQWSQTTTAETTTAALIKEHKRSQEAAIGAATMAAQQGQLDEPGGAHDIMKAAVENHVFSQKDAALHAMQFPMIAAQAKADTLISTDPINAPEAIKQFEGAIKPAVFVGIQYRARQAQKAAQTENLNGYAEDLDNSPDGTIDPDVLKKAVANNEITQRGANGLTARMERKNYATAKDESSLLMLRADDHDWVNDKNATESAADMKADGAGLPTALRKTLYEHIDAKMRSASKTGTAEEKPVETDAYARGKEAFRQGLFRPGTEIVHEPGFIDSVASFFGKDQPKTTPEIKGPDVDTDWEKESDNKTRLATQLNYAKWQDSMRGFFKENPKATSAQAEEYSQKLLQPHVMNAVKQALAPTAAQPKGNISQKDYEALPSGADYPWNGKMLKKK